MTYDQNAVRALYKKLLTLYPRAFREQLGESMEQTFNDLCRERKQETEQGWFGFVLWMFVETAIGIIREQALLITEGDAMKNILANPRSAAIISFLLVLPFMILELINRRNFSEGFPIPLFGILWLLPMIFIVILMSLARIVRAGNRMMANPANLLLLLSRVAILALIAMMWAGILVDQMPCFLGVPNCD